MKILSLNTYHGNQHDELKPWLAQMLLNKYDIFCLQETIGPKIEPLLEESFKPSEFYRSRATKEAPNEAYSLDTFTSKKYPLISQRPLFDQDDLSLPQAIAVEVANSAGSHIVIINAHGISRPGHKLDTPARIIQSETILDYAKKLTVPVVIVGDFNLLPQTRSIRMFKEHGYRNLISDYDIKTTRNEIAWARYPDSPQLFADYALVSPELIVKNFQVPDNEISDHLPLLLEIDF